MSDPRVELRSLDRLSFGSAAELAGAFGAPVLAPAWWPADIHALAHTLGELPGRGPQYQISTARHDGRPIAVIGRAQREGDPLAPVRGISGLDWHSLPELEAYSGQVSVERDAVRAVLMRDGLTVQLIGYMSEAEIVRAIESLQLVAAAP
jgi:hypothetical protein